MSPLIGGMPYSTIGKGHFVYPKKKKKRKEKKREGALLS